MEMKTTALAAVALGCCLAATPAAARQGILTCQITLSQFAEDVYADKARLTPTQLHTARQIVEIGRGQCRSGPQLVMDDITSARTAWHLPTGRHTGTQFSDFWPASPHELSMLSE
ncbi:MAG TPA: hypothetical protein VL974_07650 [Magnetospirillum sp.]|jgi:hypothetical protein|nr:hypothetical protein [Magnetospirillum sp.]